MDDRGPMGLNIVLQVGSRVYTLSELTGSYSSTLETVPWAQFQNNYLPQDWVGSCQLNNKNFVPENSLKSCLYDQTYSWFYSAANREVETTLSSYQEGSKHQYKLMNFLATNLNTSYLYIEQSNCLVALSLACIQVDEHAAEKAAHLTDGRLQNRVVSTGCNTLGHRRPFIVRVLLRTDDTE